MTLLFTPLLEDELPLDPPRQVIAVDLGFSARSETCGIAWGIGDNESAEMSFGACVERTTGLLNSAERPVLVIEAPLSGLLNGKGNPTYRKFERRGSLRRDWYCGAGASTCLAALVFLQELRTKLLDNRSHPIQLLEALVTFKEEKSGHKDDALCIYKACFDRDAATVYEVTVDKNCRLVSVLSLLGMGEEGIAPAVLEPRAPLACRTFEREAAVVPRDRVINAE